MFTLTEIKKHPEGIRFNNSFDLAEEIKERNPEIIDLKNVTAKGTISYDDDLYLLNYELLYTLTLPSSRSMKPVPLEVQDFISEVFIDEADLVEKGDLVDEELVLIVEGNSISLTESILDNILLNIPLSVLTEEEAKSDEFPSGKNWSVMTESQFQVLKEAKKQQTNPFAALNGLFDEE
ncbi:DUF177 domain-containing protein [Streptococcus sp. FT1-55]|uniref:DUF177 domain-containing protein n=1 Tax=Streptococcus sp. FT1-55 TaxID=3409805 RepID=UPI003BF600C7